MRKDKIGDSKNNPLFIRAGYKEDSAMFERHNIPQAKNKYVNSVEEYHCRNGWCQVFYGITCNMLFAYMRSET